VVRNAPLVRASREHHPRSIGVKIAVSVWLGYAPLYLAKEEGFFHKRGLDVHVVVINSPVDRRAAFAADRIQGFATTVDTLVMTAAAETRIPVRQVLVLDVSHGADGLVAKKEIKTI
jgi:NitT/TauT family transport system substrate-binding protein